MLAHIILDPTLAYIFYRLLTPFYSFHLASGVMGSQKSYSSKYQPDDLVVYFCIGHTVLWVVISVMDWLIQWRHRIIKKIGYLMFYWKMRYIRQVLFVNRYCTGTVVRYDYIIYSMVLCNPLCVHA